MRVLLVLARASGRQSLFKKMRVNRFLPRLGNEWPKVAGRERYDKRIHIKKE
jgi:hypothetical protein